MNALLMFIVFLSAVTANVHCQSAFSRCRILYSKETCYSIYTSLKDSLFENPENIYELQQAFYPMGRFTSKVLLNVRYSVSFTNDSFNNSICDGVDLADGVNSSTSNQLFFFLGWSSSEIFNIISPLQLSQLQLQIFNSFYGLFVIPGTGVTFQSEFAWKLKNATKEVVNLEQVNLIRMDLKLNESGNRSESQRRPCIPNNRLLLSSLQDITIMLKVWASASSPRPEEINEDNLGFVTYPGLNELITDYTHQSDQPIEDMDVIFLPFFAIVIGVVSFIFGISSITILGVLFPKAYSYLSNDRRHFKYYFFALAITLFLLDNVVIVVELTKVTQICDSFYYNYVSRQRKHGCGHVFTIKMAYFVSSAIFSLVAAVLSSKHCRELLQIRFIKDKRFLLLIYILCCWSIIFFLSLVVWAIAPTVLMAIVYPHIYLPLTVVMLASIFWLSVMLTIPQMFFHNITMNIKCINTLLFMLPCFGLIMLIFIIGLLTLLYVNSVVFGSDIGGPLGLALATIPSIALTFFSEFYRDWFLTRTIDTKMTDQQDMQYSNSLELKTATPALESSLESTITTDTVISNAKCINIDTSKTSNNTNEENEYNGTLKEMRRRRRAVRGRRGTRIISTGEPPGFLQKKLNNYLIGRRSRVYTTPASYYIQEATALPPIANNTLMTATAATTSKP